MIKLQNNGKLKIDIGTFHLNDYIENDIMTFLEDFNYGLTNEQPIVLQVQTDKNEYYIICNIKETYIINTNENSFQIQRIGLFKLAKEFYLDVKNQKDKIFEYTFDCFDEDTRELEKTFDLNLTALKLLLNKENFLYKSGNVTHSTLETINNALYLHTIGCVYDKFDNLETFRIFGYKKSYLITLTKRHKITTKKMEIINHSLYEIAKNVIIDLEDKKKLKRTQDLLNDIKNNLKEY